MVLRTSGCLSAIELSMCENPENAQSHQHWALIFRWLSSSTGKIMKVKTFLVSMPVNSLSVPNTTVSPSSSRWGWEDARGTVGDGWWGGDERAVALPSSSSSSSS